MTHLTYRHVDVFSHMPLSGNGLTVFSNCEGLDTQTMQKITQEMKQFESIFLFPTENAHCFSARIFTVEEELAFAGHPILGAAAVLHERSLESSDQEWHFQLAHKTVKTQTSKKGHNYFATMEQEKPLIEKPVKDELVLDFLKIFNLSEKMLHQHLPLQVVSTGLPYLIIPVKEGLDQARITSTDLESKLSSIGAKFCYLLDVSRLEGRTWDNLGLVEDVATGSAAGPVGAYLVYHGLIEPHSEIVLHQGRYAGRPSQIFIHIKGTRQSIESIQVSGEVCMIASGAFDHFGNQTELYRAL